MPRVNERVARRPVVSGTALDVMMIVAASALVALAARFAIPLPGTPVPLSLVNLAVLLVGMAMGGKRGFAAMVLYLGEGLAGLPVFSPTGPGGVAQLLGPTGGYLIAYPVVAFLAGWLFQSDKKDFKTAVAAATVGEIVLFTVGVNWLVVLFHVPLAEAAVWGLYPFLAAEVVKVVGAAGIASKWHLDRT